MVGHEPVRQLSHRRRATLSGFLVRRIVPVRHRPEDNLGARPGVFWCDFADRRDGVAPHGCAAPYARPIHDHVGLRAGRAHAHTEAAHAVIPQHELAAVSLEAIHRALRDPLGCHGSLAAVRPGQHRGNTETELPGTSR
jgi:hypothetical protein